MHHGTGVQLKADPRSDPLEGSDVTLKCDSQKLKRRDPVEWSVVFASSVNGIETILTPTNSVVLPNGNNFNNGIISPISELVLYFFTITI